MNQPRRKILLFILIFLLAAPLQSRPPASKGFTILLTNDDGYDAPGLQALIRALLSEGDVYVAAPADNQSGKGHSVTVDVPLIVAERNLPNGNTGYAIQATPASCVQLGLNALVPKKPDVVISGINRGENLGLVVYYSGTVGAAREAAMSGRPAIAVSMQGDDEKDYEATAAYVRKLLGELRARHLLKPGFFLNVNAPAGMTRGVRVTRLSMKSGGLRFERRKGPDGRSNFQASWQPVHDDSPGTDVAAFDHGYITLTPLMLDATASKAIGSLGSLETESIAAAAN